MLRPALENGEEFVDRARDVHAATVISMKGYLSRRQDSRVGLYLHQEVTPPPAGRLTYQQVREAATKLSQRADATAEVLRSLNKLRLIVVHFCSASHN